MRKEREIDKIIKELNKESTVLYKIIEEKDKLIKAQRRYIWELLNQLEELLGSDKE